MRPFREGSYLLNLRLDVTIKIARDQLIEKLGFYDTAESALTMGDTREDIREKINFLAYQPNSGQRVIDEFGNISCL